MTNLITKMQKRNLLNEFEDNIQNIYNAYIKKCRKKSDISATKRVQILDIKKDFSDYDIESVLCFDICHIYQLEYKFVSFSFDFPKSFDSFDELKEKTNIHIYLFSEREFKFKTIKFVEFEKNCSDYLYISNHIKNYNVFEYIQDSQSRLTETLFVDLMMDGNNKELSEIVQEIKQSEDVFINALESKNKYIQKRREINRKRKEHKKKNKSSANNEVLKNESKIKELQREIQKLQNINNSLKSNAKGEYITNEGAKTLKSLMKKYETDFGSFGNLCIKRIHRLTDFRRKLFSTFFEI